ncbi:TPA: hypothetical protein DHW58_00455, partial [Patescibacteria group bacterium]|nr:hypothetical protein [Patescibacteria group bacterium]
MTKPVIGMALSAVLAAWWLPIFALAQTGGVGVIPKPVEGQPPRSWFVHTLRPGESTTDTLVINNNSPRTKSVVVEALDAVNTTEGGYTLVKTAADNREVGSWIKLEQTNLILAPNTSAEVPFTITVPGDTGPGQHSGGIVIYERAGGQAGGNINFQIRVGARVYITVPGEITRKLSFDKVDYKIDKSGLTFNITAKNESNINIEPALDIKLQGIFGSRTEEMNENGTYLPGSVMNITKVWDRPAPKFGYYRIAVVAHTWTVDEVQLDGTVKKLPDERFEYKFSFWVGTKYLGWWLLGLGLAWLK